MLFKLKIDDLGINQAIIDLLDNKLDIIAKLTDEIYNTKDNDIYIYSKYGKEKIYNDLLDIYIKELDKAKKEDRMHNKATKDFYQEKLFYMVVSDIEEAKEKGATIENIRKAIQTSEYKKMTLKDFEKTTRNFDKSIFDSVYNLTINKVLRVYKNDETEQQETKQNKIPLGWKVYLIAKAINKITKAKL